ncbi:MAG TPA: fructose-6-phosphate aldolase [Alphaproteobacteria bacterium]|nr:fructose-6-phosphate aldolase [Alphaproteobacteria bacterium]
MLLFLDTAIIEDVRRLSKTGLIDGVTTNPSLIASASGRFEDIIIEMCELVEGPVSAEVVASNAQDMIEQGRYLAGLAANVAVKVPLTPEGLKACKALSEDDISVNITLCFSPLQALLAAKAGASMVSPFVGRLDDIGHNGMFLVEEILDIFANYPQYQTAVLAASIRHPQHVLKAAELGAHIVTIPPKVFEQMYLHPLTSNGLDQFEKDWSSKKA